MPRRDVGRPRLAANRWLADALRAHPALTERPAPTTCPVVYDEWRQRHEQERGWKLASPPRSFRAAITSIARNKPSY